VRRWRWLQLDINRHPDWAYSPGSEAELTVGPILLGISTADGLSLYAGVLVREHWLGWQYASPEHRP
jgi:hypothetical protein